MDELLTCVRCHRGCCVLSAALVLETGGGSGVISAGEGVSATGISFDVEDRLVDLVNEGVDLDIALAMTSPLI